MTCPKCQARNQLIRDLSGDIVCLLCGASPTGILQPVQPRAQVCSRGHPMPDGPPCYPCVDAVGRSSPAVNAEQRATMRGAIRK